MTTIEPSLLALSQRLAACEADARRTRRGALLLAGAAAASLLAFASQEPKAAGPVEVRASNLVLLDRDGKTRARLGLDENDAPQLVLIDKAGTTRFKLAIDKDAEILASFADAKGQTRLGCAVDAGDHPHLLLMDAGQKPRLHLAVSEQGAPSLVCIHEDGAMSAGLGIHADGRSWLRNDTAAGTDKTKAGGPPKK